MRMLGAWLLILGLAVPATASDVTMDNRPVVVFPGPKGGIVHQTPYPQSSRSAAVWNADGCWRACQKSCTWNMEYCVRGTDPDQCRPHLDACDRSCQRSCRAWWQGPLLGFVDF